MKTYHLAVDLGATSGRTILATFDGKKVETEEISRFKYPMLPIAGHLFWDLPFLFQEIISALKKTGERLGEEKLASIGIDTWGCDVAYFYKNGTISGLPYCYRDSHTEGAIERFSYRMSKDKLYEKTGIQFMDFNTVFQLFTVMENSPETIESADRILFIPDALSYMLTGHAVMEYTVASTSQMVNPKTGELDEDILRALGIHREKFGAMVKPGEIIGLLTQQIQDYTGLGGVPVVAVAGHDTASAVIAVPTPDENYAYLSCGTWSLLGIESPEAIITPKSREYNFTNEGGIDGTTRFLKNICGLWIFERCREEFKDKKWGEVPENISELSALCEQSKCESVINPDHSMFAHPASMIKAIEVYCEDTGQEVPKTPADFIRVIYRSLAKRYKEVLDWLKECSPVEVKRLHVIGGGSLNPYLMQYAADELGIPVVAGPTESTALGNILVQLQAGGKVKNLQEMRNVAIASTTTKTYNPKKVVSC
ncbi:MAG: rhamnulokinase [Muribaculaceae bacterium]|nr:rhamnulokinase [Muribaculaceae bacterium]